MSFFKAILHVYIRIWMDRISVFLVIVGIKIISSGIYVIKPDTETPIRTSAHAANPAS